MGCLSRHFEVDQLLPLNWSRRSTVPRSFGAQLPELRNQRVQPGLRWPMVAERGHSASISSSRLSHAISIDDEVGEERADPVAPAAGLQASAPARPRSARTVGFSCWAPTPRSRQYSVNTSA